MPTKAPLEKKIAVPKREEAPPPKGTLKKKKVIFLLSSASCLCPVLFWSGSGCSCTLVTCFVDNCPIDAVLKHLWF